MHRQKGFLAPKCIDDEFIPHDGTVFSDEDQARLHRESTLQENMRQLVGNDYAKLKKPVSGFYAIGESYSAFAPKESRRSTMSLMAKIDGKYYPTNACLDPFWRAPVLGEYSDKYTRSGRLKQDEEPVEHARGLRSHLTYKPKPFKVGAQGYFITKGYVDSEVPQRLAWKDGRKLVALNEIWGIVEKFQNISFIVVPMTELKQEKLVDIAKNMLQMTKGPFELKSNDSTEAKATIEQVLRCHGFRKSSWDVQILVLTRNFDDYADNEEKITQWANDAKTISANVYTTPVFVDQSVIDEFWEVKNVSEENLMGERFEVVPKLPRPKRGIENVTFFESDSKLSKKLTTLAEIRDEVSDLNELCLQAQIARLEDERQILLGEHGVKAKSIQEAIMAWENQNDIELETLRERIKTISKQLETSKELQKLQQSELQEMSDNLDKLENQKSSADPDSEKEKIAQLEAVINEQKALLQVKSGKIDELVREAKILEDERTRYREKLSNDLIMKNELSEMEVDLKNSCKKSRSMIKQNISPVRLHIDDTEDEESFSSAQNTLHNISKVKYSNHMMAMTLTPSKVGLKAWDDNLQSFSAWFLSMRMQIEAAQSQVTEEKAVIRLILMCLPSKYAWVANQIADDSSCTTLEKAKAKIISLIYGEKGLIDEFFNLKIAPGEHPLAFLQRIKSDLQPTEDLDSGFVTRSIIEKLVKNLDASTTVELKRILSGKDSNKIKFENIRESLQKAVQLTGLAKDNNLSNIGTEILMALQQQGQRTGGYSGPRKETRACFICKKVGHIAKNCWKRKSKGKFTDKNGNKRESKGKKDGSRPQGSSNQSNAN